MPVKVEGFQYDFFAGEWSFHCKVCRLDLYAPTKNDLRYALWKHTHEECLGGW